MKYIEINTIAGEYVRALGGYFWMYFFEVSDEWVGYCNYCRSGVRFFSYTAPEPGDVLVQTGGGYILLDKHARQIIAEELSG